MSEDKVAIAKLEIRLDNIEGKVDKLSESNELLYKLSVISESQVELNRNQSKQMTRMESTFNEMNISLSNMNNSQLALRDSIEKIGERVDVIESDLEVIDKRDSVSISEQTKKWVIWILVGLPMMILGSYIMLKLGLK